MDDLQCTVVKLKHQISVLSKSIAPRVLSKKILLWAVFVSEAIHLFYFGLHKLFSKDFTQQNSEVFHFNE